MVLQVLTLGSTHMEQSEFVDNNPAEGMGYIEACFEGASPCRNDCRKVAAPVAGLENEACRMRCRMVVIPYMVACMPVGLAEEMPEV